MCPQQYFLEYNCGIRGLSNKKADLGTIVHKVLEVIAVCKKGRQDKKRVINDDICGKVSTTKYSIDEIIDKVFTHYSTNLTHHDWTIDDFKNCKKWTYKALEFNDGQFNPANRTIVDAEPFFDIEIQEPWAHYNYSFGDSQVEGFLSIKGTIDLVTQVEGGVYEVVDWKTGRRLNWATGEVKTHSKLREDPQLRMYHYAVHKMYKVDQVLVTIFYINDGGPFTICFDGADLSKTEDMLKGRFEEIQQDVRPALNKSWKCSRFCHYGMNSFEGTHVKPCLGNNGYITQCAQVNSEFRYSDLDQVIGMYKTPGYKIGHYQDPGSV
jgi:CRISPR/Cas system-associated exonuclease Cas4 (RecB family)